MIVARVQEISFDEVWKAEPSSIMMQALFLDYFRNYYRAENRARWYRIFLNRSRGKTWKQCAKIAGISIGHARMGSIMRLRKLSAACTGKYIVT